MDNNLQTQTMPQRTTISGVFRLRQPKVATTRYGQPYLRIKLEDNSKAIYAYSWKEEIFKDLNLVDLCCVHIEGIIRWHNQQQIIDIQYIEKIHQMPAKATIRLIPQSICPQPWLLPILQDAIAKITITPLQQFIADIFSNDSISFAYITCPASLNHHHNYPGGLLMHSLECFSMIEKHRQFQKSDYELGLVAALLHDIGKILTMTHTMQRTSIGTSLDHDKLTLEIIGPYFHKLQQQWPAGASQLRYLLTWKLNLKIPKYNMADLVACCDRMSTGLEMEKRKLVS